MPEVILIGTFHQDFKGKERLERILSAVKPDILTLEMSLEGVAVLERGPNDCKEFIASIRKQGAPREVISYLEEMCSRYITPFELTATNEYSKTHGIPLLFVDDPEESATVYNFILAQLREFAAKTLPPEKYLKMMRTDEELQSEADAAYKLFTAAFSGKAPPKFTELLLNSIKSELNGQRDAYMASKIRETVVANPERKVAHVGGAVHMVDGPESRTLYSLLKDMNPRRVLIYEADGWN